MELIYRVRGHSQQEKARQLQTVNEIERLIENKKGEEYLGKPLCRRVFELRPEKEICCGWILHRAFLIKGTSRPIALAEKPMFAWLI